MEDEDLLRSTFEKYINKRCRGEISNLLNATEDLIHYGVKIDVSQLGESEDTDAAQILLDNPIAVLPLLDDAIIEAQISLKKGNPEFENCKVKINSHARLCELPVHCYKSTVSSIRCGDLHKMLKLSGTVIRTGGVKMLEAEREYQCNECAHKFRVFSDLEQNSIIELPSRCPSQPEGKKKRCKSRRFTYVEGTHVCRDYQEIKIQEIVQKLTVGSVPRSMLVVCHDDLVESCQAGDDVDIVGIVRNMWNPVIKDERCVCEIFIEANSIKINNDTKSRMRLDEELKQEFEEFWIKHQGKPMRARDHIVSGICPQLYGLYAVKLAVALTLIGGVAKRDKSGTKIRGENHLLLVGDPGTGKSQLLRVAAKLAPRSVLTTGIGTTSAGLTVAAVKEKGGSWGLEAGALVLADGGICCIDEFGCVREHDRLTIHEAMEQQTLSIAKAGLVCTLNTRTTIFAVMNPKGRYDVMQDLTVNCAIASPLLSRFDLILLILDSQNEEWDKKVAKHIMDQQPTIEDIEDLGCTQAPAAPEGFQEKDEENKLASEETALGPPWPMEKMQAYIHYVKTHFKPNLSKFSERILVRYYQTQRSTDHEKARTTIRLLESLIRLAQAHSRLMFRDTVFPQDAIAAIILVEASLATSGLTDDASALHMSFDENPDKLFRKKKNELLEKLDLGRIPIQERIYSYYVHLRQGAGQECEILTPVTLKGSQLTNSQTTLPSVLGTQYQYQVLVKKGGNGFWCDLTSCIEHEDGTFEVVVADTKVARELGIAEMTTSNIEHDCIRERPGSSQTESQLSAYTRNQHRNQNIKLNSPVMEAEGKSELESQGGCDVRKASQASKRKAVDIGKSDSASNPEIETRVHYAKGSSQQSKRLKTRRPLQSLESNRLSSDAKIEHNASQERARLKSSSQNLEAKQIPNAEAESNPFSKQSARLKIRHPSQSSEATRANQLDPGSENIQTQLDSLDDVDVLEELDILGEEENFT